MQADGVDSRLGMAETLWRIGPNHGNGGIVTAPRDMNFEFLLLGSFSWDSLETQR